MFLDRFSAHPSPAASPAPSQRSYSPRRPGQLSSAISRSALNPRSSSLTSLVSRANSSSGSLPGSARLTNGSSLRQSTAAPPHVDDPLQVLERIVGVTLKGKDEEEERAESLDRPQELIESIDFGGLSLQDFVRSVGELSTRLEEGARMEEVQSVEECEYVRLDATSIRAILRIYRR